MVNESDKAKSSRDLFGDSNINRNMGTRRLNRMPLVILMLLGGIVLAAIGYTYYSKSHPSSNTKDDGEKRPAPSSALSLLSNAPLAGLIDSKKDMIDDPVARNQIAKKHVVPPTAVPQIPAALQQQLDALINKKPESKPQPVAPPVPQLTDYEKALLALEQARQKALNSAIHSTTTIVGGQQKSGPQQATETSNVNRATNPYTPNVPAVTTTSAANDPDKDPNKQQEKKDFLNQKADNSSDYLPNGRIKALTPYEVKAGTVIPSVMISGVNSDIPGQLIAQVSENVYDTAKGLYILIPQGARIVGSFDSSVSSGQERVLVVWRRIIYPDGSSINLGSMPGGDQAGYSGLHDQVNNHYLRTFGNAFLLSIFSAASQLSQPNTNNNSGSGSNSTSNSAQQTAAAALGQQLTQLGTDMIRKNMDIAPTLVIRPGYKFIIMVNKDILLSPWQYE